MLELTKQFEKNFSNKELEQIKNEHKQILNSDIISAPTTYAYNFTSKLFNKEFFKIPNYIIPNFIDNDFNKVKQTKREKACINFNKIVGKNIIFTKNINIFCVGSLEYRKGIDLILKIVEKLIDKNNFMHFYLIGHYEKKKKF